MAKGRLHLYQDKGVLIMSLFGSFFKATDSLDSKVIGSPLELVTYAASLVSNPADIDPLLDPVRKITAMHAPGEDLSPANESEIFEVYIKLEKYLMTSDPIRTFTKAELRSRLSADLTSKLAEHETQGGL